MYRCMYWLFRDLLMTISQHNNSAQPFEECHIPHTAKSGAVGTRAKLYTVLLNVKLPNTTHHVPGFSNFCMAHNQHTGTIYIKEIWK